jgi:hypothetical protein
MKNKEVFQNKVSRLESMLNSIGRAVSTNDRQQAYDDIEKAKAMLGDLQTMLNREETTFN